jgi:secreted trypsin-like serine protease
MLVFFKDFSQCGINFDPRRLANSISIGVWPWMGSLGTHKEGNWSHHCGATLIDETKVITAAHCVNAKIDVLTK